MTYLLSISKRWSLSLLAFACAFIAVDAGTLGADNSTPATHFPASLGSNIITNSVMAKDTHGEYLDPVGITDTFPQSQSVFHAVVTMTDAPANTVVKAVWLTDSNGVMGEAELTSNGTRNIDFTFKPDAGTLPEGHYKVEIYLNNTLNRTLNFTVEAAQQTGQNTPSTMNAPHASGYIKEVVLAKDVQGQEKLPVNVTDTFSPTDSFHAVVTIDNAPRNTKFEATWYALDVGDAAPKNTLINSGSVVTEGSRNIDFAIKTFSKWPVGTYGVGISVDGVPDTARTFLVK